MKHLIPAFVLAGLATASLGATLASSEAGFSRLDPPLVIDADGKIVGRYSYAAGQMRTPVVLFDIGGTLTEAPLDAYRDTPLIAFERDARPFHTTIDCTGVSYINQPPAAGVRAGEVVHTRDDRLLFYLADGDRRIESIEVLSFGIPGHCRQRGQVVSDVYLSTSPPIDLSTRFRLPFHLR